MKYQDGNIACIGDEIRMLHSESGVVVCSIDNSEYSNQFNEKDWSYLKKGILVKTSFAGIVHYKDNRELVSLIKRNIKQIY